ncbi:DEAD/DEAH box helicase [Candidatus Thorarchaeota archaeon]|nr:MAG: DEAD/DEAH box helicase [Candidatus Thorarchaeota archaeon]
MTVATDVTSEVSRLLNQAGMRPRGIQSEAISKGLLQGQSIMVCSPTGSGKTLVGEMALLRAVTCDKKGVYLVPLRALAVQVYKTMRERYEHMGVQIGLSTGDFQNNGDDLEDFDILVTTYERTDSLLRKDTSWLSSIGTVVIDEIQTLSEIGRGSRLESLVIRLRKTIEKLQIVALSATIGAPDELAEWLNCHLIESYERPVPLIYRVITTNDRNKSIKKLVMTTVQGNGQAVVFHRTRREAEVYAKRLAEDVGRQFTSEEKKKLDQELDSVENYDLTLSPELRSVLRNGTAYHHAGLGYYGRRIIEKLFISGLVRVICATTTLAAGMDLPARTVILSNIKSPADYKLLLSANTVHQMLGRAGRPSHDKIGFGVIITGSAGEAEQAKRRYFEVSMDEKTSKEQLIPKYERINSTLGKANSLTEQLLVVLDMLGSASIEEVENTVLGDSFLIHCAIRDKRAPMRVLQLGEISAITVLERHALPDTIQSARKNLLGKTILREKNETVIGGLVTSVDGGLYTCRFSARLSTLGTVEGPMCSCGNPIAEDGILCHHLVILGMTAASELGTLADYVIPLSLSESSPLDFLIRLGLIEGASSGKIKPTKLGRATNRLYLSIPSVREILALLPKTDTSGSMLWLLRHIVSIETGVSLDDSFDNLMGSIITTDITIRDLALQFSFSIGDVYGLIDTSRWLLHSISVLADLGSLKRPLELSRGLIEALEKRFSNNVEEED